MKKENIKLLQKIGLVFGIAVIIFLIIMIILNILPWILFSNSGISILAAVGR